MKNKKWSEILKNNEEAIIDALQKIYRDACGGQGNSGFSECVDIYPSGKISTYTIGDNSTDGDVWSGEAYEIARCKWFDPIDNIDDMLDFLRNENSLETFSVWLVKEEHIEPDEACDESELLRHAWRVEDWNSELWKQYVSEAIDYLVSERAIDWANEKFDMALMEAEEDDRQHGY